MREFMDNIKRIIFGTTFGVIVIIVLIVLIIMSTFSYLKLCIENTMEKTFESKRIFNIRI